MPTANPAPTTAAANSSDITVVAGTPITVGLYLAAGGPLPSGIIAQITRKNPSGTYDITGETLSARTPNWSLTTPGVYRVEKPVTPVAVGISTD